MKNKKFKKKAQEGNMMSTIVTLAIVLGVIGILVISGYFMYKWGVFDFIENLPGFNKQNQSAERTACPIDSQEIGYLEKNYIIINTRTNLYLSNNNIYLDASGVDPVVGKIVRENNRDAVKLIDDGEWYTDGKGKFASSDYIKLMPSRQDMLLLGSSFLEDTTICLKNEFIQAVQKNKECVLTCSLMEGVCSKTPISGKVSDTRLDCKSDELCYVDLSYSKLSSDNMKLGDGSYILTYNNLVNPAKLSDIINSDTLIMPIGVKMEIVTYLNSPIGFCYAYDSNRYYMAREYIDADVSSSGKYSHVLSTNMFMASNQDIIQFIAWNNEKNEKVIKRWKVERKSLEDSGFTEPGNLIDDKDFALKLSNAPVLDKNNPKESTFYVVLNERKSFSSTKNAQVFEIVKESSSRAQIWAYDETTSQWKMLKCGGGFYSTIKLSDISSTLSATLDRCGW